MRSTEVVESFPGLQFLVQIDIVCVSQQLVELLLICQMGSLDLAVKLRCTRSDVHVPDALVFDMPVELGLELVTAVRTDRVDSKWKLLDDMVDEVDGVLLGVVRIDPQGPDTACIVDGGVLEPSNASPLGISEPQKLDVSLDMMAGSGL